MVSGRSTGHSLASELVESNDGHEEIIKVSLVHLPSLSPLLLLTGVREGAADFATGFDCGLTRRNQTCNASSWVFSWKDPN